ncbi:MAG: hypothetical protein PF572_00990 [Patescibacteria group bacterium]|jgi:hypothetical protein|nr:hypothetical protein [Patescibacteria group bacterium]
MKIIKIILVLLVVFFVFGIGFILKIDSAISDGFSKFIQYYQKDVLPFYIFLLKILSLVSGGFLIRSILKNYSLRKYSSFIAMHSVVFVTAILLFFPNPIISDEIKIKKLGGVTEESCDKGKSIFPWATHEYYYYPSKCFTFYNKCDKIDEVFGLRFPEFNCYKDQGVKFETREDCEILNNKGSKEKCLATFILAEEDISRCLSGDYPERIMGQDFRNFNSCLMSTFQISTILLASDREKERQLNLSQCNELTDIKKDSCFSNMARMYEEIEFCDKLSSSIPGLKQRCYEYINK